MREDRGEGERRREMQNEKNRRHRAVGRRNRGEI
jgi:hypothetical protein